MMKRFVIAFAMLVSTASVTFTPHAAEAQEIEVSGPLAGAPAVINMRVYREFRLQIQAQATMTLTDEYSRTVLFGGQLMFHPFDWLGFGVWGGFAPLNIDTTLADEVAAKGQTNENNVVSLPDRTLFPDQIAQIKWMAAPQVAFIPLRGKLGIFESLFVDTDFYVVGGVAFVGLDERVAVSEAECTAVGPTTQRGCATLVGRESRSTIAFTGGVGLSMYMNDFLALTLEWRAMPFAWNTSGTDESGNPRGEKRVDENDRLPHFNHMISLGFAFYLPTEPELSYAEDEAEPAGK